MRDKIVVVTGAGSGLGACIAKEYSARGAKLVMLDISQQNLDSTAKELMGESHSYVVDISSKAEVDDTFEQIYEEVGYVDILVNCAGIGKYDLAEKVEEKFIHGMIDINLKGTIFCTLAVLETMKANNRGYIVNVVSKSGKRANPTEAVYCASKFGVEGFSKAVEIELEGTAIRTTNFYMGNMATNLWKGTREDEMSTFIDPRDMAEIIVNNTLIRPHLIIEEVSVRNLLIEDGE